MSDPKLILLFSGKRKAGKDYICARIQANFADNCQLIRISEPLKSLYAQNHNLDLKELLSDSPYKEKYRLEMIEWSEKIREENPGYFCKAACEKAVIKPLWIVCDVRRKTDIEWFKKTYGSRIRTVRISARQEVRCERGWIFTKGVDDVTSECDLDDWDHWDVIVDNSDEEGTRNAIDMITSLIKSVLL